MDNENLFCLLKKLIYKPPGRNLEGLAHLLNKLTEVQEK